jgi:aerobic carbon-monoxide dehydrogenase large subunit
VSPQISAWDIATSAVLAANHPRVGGALLEELAYDGAGQMLATTLMDYVLPGPVEMPRAVSIAVLEETPTPLNPLGIKGAGEGGIVGAGGAIANAVADALRPWGAGVTALPLTPSRVRALVGGARSDRPLDD